MRCSRCDKVNSNSVGTRMCWKKWKLCGGCAKFKHPEYYQHKRKIYQIKVEESK